MSLERVPTNIGIMVQSPLHSTQDSEPTISIDTTGLGPVLQTDGLDNVDQNLLNLEAGTNITLTDQGNGTVTIDATGGAGGTVTHTGALTANLPVFGNAAADVKVGTKSGNTNELATVSGALTATHVVVADASGNLIDGGAAPAAGTVTHTGALTADAPMFGNAGADSKVGTKSGNTNELATVSGALTATHVVVADASGNLIDGGAAPAAGTVTHTGALTADAPMFGNAGADSKVGTKSGNTNELATVSGALTATHVVVADASGNLIDGGPAPSSGPTSQNDVTGSRSIGTVFHNTLSKPLYVAIQFSCGNNNGGFVTTDAANPPVVTVGNVFFTNGQPAFATLFFIVLAGNFYLFHGTGAGTVIGSWIEWS